MESESSTNQDFGFDLMASTLAHEIRNPLQAMRIQVESAIRGASPSDAIVQISKSLDRLERVMNKVQRLSEKYQLNPQVTNLQTLVEGALAGSKLWLQAAGIEVSVRTQWEGAPLCELDGDLFEQVILNFVSNSIQAMPNGGRLQIQIFECADSAEILIQDSGYGIDKEVISKLGTPFFTTKQGGNGLGIAFCKTIIAMHKGQVQFESEPGSGTIVRLQIPKFQRD